MLADESTRWGTIRDLDDHRRTDVWQQAWAHLVERYRPVLVAYARGLLRRMGGPALAQNDADEVVDGFLAACVEKGWLSRADPTHGRFRVFIRVLLARYARDWMDHRRAQKRMPDGGPPISLDPLQGLVDDAPGDGAAELMNREWAECMAAGAVERVRVRSKRNARVLEVLLANEEVDRSALAERLGKQPHQVALIIFQSRRMMAEELWNELKETVADIDQLDEERSALKPFLEHYLDPEMAQSFFGLPLGRLLLDGPSSAGPPPA